MEPVPKRKQRKSQDKLNVPVFIVAVMIIMALSYGLSFHTNQGKRILGIETSAQNVSSSSTSTQFTFFNGYDFESLYEQTAYPNTKASITEVPITGNSTLDARIRQIAESRAYKPQAQPTQPVSDIQVQENGILLQPLAFNDVLQMIKQADAEGIPLKVQTSHRTVEEQRDVFLRQLGPVQANAEQIQSGMLDARITQVLEDTAPPGYSRLQTGYAVVFACRNTSGLFKNSTCYTWLKANNFVKAKQHGFIPSYSDGVGAPEARNETEYVWVGTSKLN